LFGYQKNCGNGDEITSIPLDCLVANFRELKFNNEKHQEPRPRTVREAYGTGYAIFFNEKHQEAIDHVGL